MYIRNKLAKIKYSPILRHRTCAIIHRPYFLIIIMTYMLISIIINTNQVSASNTFKLNRNGSQGASITQNNFIFTDWTKGDNGVDVYICNRSGKDFSGCKKIISDKDLEHANVIQNEWGSQYFWVFDEGNAAKNAKKWCFDFSGNKVNNSNCGKIPRNEGNNSHVTTPSKQGYTEIQGFFLKGGSGEGQGPNKIYIRKDGEKDTIKTLDVGHDDKELEDVSVDGSTGEIYYTVVDTGSKTLYLDKVTDYVLPIKPGAASSTIGSIGESPSSGSTGQDSDRVKPAKPKTPQDIVHHDSKYDGTVETNFFGTIKENGKGCGIFGTIAYIIDVLTFGVSIVATISIVYSGIIILTAKGSPDRVTKAKRRLMEIVIGLALYAAFYAILGFLLPGGQFSGKECSINHVQDTSDIVT